MSATTAPIHSQLGVRFTGRRLSLACGRAIGAEVGILFGVIACSKVCGYGNDCPLYGRTRDTKM